MEEARIERRRLLGSITAIVDRDIGRVCLSQFPSIFGGGPERVQIPRADLEAAGVDAEVGSRFMALANITAEKPEQVEPSDFEPVAPLNPSDELYKI